jgi:hypothetical protein
MLFLVAIGGIIGHLDGALAGERVNTLSTLRMILPGAGRGEKKST